MRISKATFQVTVKHDSDEYRKLSDLMITFGGEKSGKITVNGVELDVYAMDAGLDIEYPDCVTFTVETKALHPAMVTDLIESVYNEKNLG